MLLQIFCKLITYFQKYDRSRRHWYSLSLSKNGLIFFQTALFVENLGRGPNMVNPLMLAVTKRSLTISRKSCRQEHSRRNISRGNVLHNTTNNYPSNILLNHSQFQSYRQKYRGSRRQLSWTSPDMNGLTLMLPVFNLANTKRCKKAEKLLKSCHMGTYLRVSRWELSHEYQHDRV